jgi:hypothetical protein
MTNTTIPTLTEGATVLVALPTRNALGTATRIFHLTDSVKVARVEFPDRPAMLVPSARLTLC